MLLPRLHCARRMATGRAFARGCAAIVAGFSCSLRAADFAAMEETTHDEAKAQTWNWHVQNTDIVQGDPSFPAKYSGANSLRNDGEVRDSVSLDLYAGVRLWPGAEAHVDTLVWQGFGLSKTRGVDGFPNGEAFRTGNDIPNINVARVTLTLGKMSAKDIFDNNSYANDPRTQFMNWALMANEAWDYPADSLGY